MRSTKASRFFKAKIGYGMLHGMLQVSCGFDPPRTPTVPAAAPAVRKVRETSNGERTVAFL